jgi:hypothetical protein
VGLDTTAVREAVIKVMDQKVSSWLYCCLLKLCLLLFPYFNAVKFEYPGELTVFILPRVCL